MTLPTTIRIAGTDYAVSFAPSVSYSDPDTIGRCVSQDQALWVDGNLSAVRQRQVLLHELVHAVSNHFAPGCELTESQVQAVERGLWALFKDNPGLGAQLFGSAT